MLISFHDLNPSTARRMTECLHILVDEARRVGLQRRVPPPEERELLLRDSPQPDNISTNAL